MNNNTLFIILFVILFALIIFVIGIIMSCFFWYKKKQKTVISEDKSFKQNSKSKDNFQAKIVDLENEKLEYKQATDKYYQKLKELSHLDERQVVNEYKKYIFNEVSPSLNKEVKDYIDDTWIQANQKANIILVEAMERISKPLIQEISTSSIVIPDEILKAKIIGKEGRNKKFFENITGTNLIIEKDNNFIVISSTNPIRRVVAINVLKQLFELKSIEPTKIENAYNKELKQFDENLHIDAKNIITSELGIDFEQSDIFWYLGRMKYRSSYGQNALSHIIECAKIAAAIADELKLDRIKAMKAALLHDIGKSLDYELDKNHVDLGVEIATNLNLEDYIINAIKSHHDEIPTDNIYSQITKIADGISAARPGARMNSYNDYFERIQELEKIISQYEEVNNCYVIRSGRYLRVIVNPTKVMDNDMQLLAYKIKKNLETNPIIKKYKIKVALIKENKFEFETSSNNTNII